MRVAAIFLLLLICAAFVGRLLLPLTSPPSFWSLLVAAVVSLYWLFTIQINTWNASRGFSKRPGANAEIEWEFSDDEIKSRWELAAATMSWKSFMKVLETNDGFLFYPVRNFLYWIPFEAFDDPSCVEKIREHLRQNGITLLGP